MFCCTSLIPCTYVSTCGQWARPASGGKGDEWELFMGQTGSSALEALHLETEASGRICIVLSLQIIRGLRCTYRVIFTLESCKAFTW